MAAHLLNLFEGFVVQGPWGAAPFQPQLITDLVKALLHAVAVAPEAA